MLQASVDIQYIIKSLDSRCDDEMLFERVGQFELILSY